jgi:fibro-slime domain-containing protein
MAAVLSLGLRPAAGVSVADAQQCPTSLGGATTAHAIIRDFTSTHTDFNVSDGDSAPFVASSLGQDGKPRFSPGSAGTTTVASAESFASWWNDDPDPAVSQSLTTDLTLSNACEADPRVFSFSGSPYYPIDNTLVGNQGSTHNNFFTEEVHSTLSYRGGEVLRFASSGDLWVFVNGHLAVDLGGVHPTRSSTLNLDVARVDLQIVPGKSYAVDLFYAHRGMHAPLLSFQLTTPLASCDPLTAAVTSTPGSADLAVVGRASLNAGNLRVISANSGSSFAGAGWYRRALYLVNGFSTDFDFTLTSAAPNPEGFAFVVQGSSVTARGNSGDYLGYDGIPGGVAVEFDTHPSKDFQDPGFQHVSVHASSNDAALSARETASIGQSVVVRTPADADRSVKPARAHRISRRKRPVTRLDHRVDVPQLQSQHCARAPAASAQHADSG